MFVGLHALAGEYIAPELSITDDEGKDFMDAAKNVMRHYSVAATQKTVDWIAFGGIVGGIYGSRAIAINIRRRDERRGKKEAQSVPPKPNGVDHPTVTDHVAAEPPTIRPDPEQDPFG